MSSQGCGCTHCGAHCWTTGRGQLAQSSGCVCIWSKLFQAENARINGLETERRSRFCLLEVIHPGWGHGGSSCVRSARPASCGGFQFIPIRQVHGISSAIRPVLTDGCWTQMDSWSWTLSSLSLTSDPLQRPSLASRLYYWIFRGDLGATSSE